MQFVDIFYDFVQAKRWTTGNAIQVSKGSAKNDDTRIKKLLVTGGPKMNLTHTRHKSVWRERCCFRTCILQFADG